MKTHVATFRPVLLVSSFAILIFISTPAAFLKPDFSGEWALDEAKSNRGEFGGRMTAGKLSVKKEGDMMIVVRNATGPMGEVVTTDKITLDGKESPSTGGMEGSIRKTTSTLSADQNTISVSTATVLNFNGTTFNVAVAEVWSLSADGKALTIDTESNTQMGVNKAKLVYNKL